MNKGMQIRNVFLMSIVLFLLIVCIFHFVSYYLYFHEEKINEELELSLEEEQTPLEKKLQIMNPDSNSRPIAVMINNHDTARPYHSGLQDAYVIYEMIAEGGYTRNMALFKDKATERIGSVRSSRPYFLDYVLEHDAIYVHWGWSPQAESDIATLGIANINGLTYDGKYFYRDHTLGVPLEHTGFTSMSLIQNAIGRLKYRKTTTEKSLLGYSVASLDYSTYPSVLAATHIHIPYSSMVKTSYIYDSTTQVYFRYVNNEVHSDYVTKEPYTFKNIILYQVANKALDSYGRQTLDNINKGTGYYISLGMAVPITWEKSARGAQTIYRLTDGTPLQVNDGNTFIQIQPLSQQYEIS